MSRVLIVKQMYSEKARDTEERLIYTEMAGSDKNKDLYNTGHWSKRNV